MKKTVLITGATKGIGRAVAIRFAKGGWDIVSIARTYTDNTELAQHLSEAYGVLAWAYTGDASKREDVRAVKQSLENENIHIDVLINNVGEFASGNLLEEAEGQMERMMEVNLYSAYFMAQAFAPAMREKKAGHIINICSVASQQAKAGGGSYAMAKHALLGFTNVLREDLRPDSVGVTAILPSATYTNSWIDVPVSPERLMDANDVAESIWLCCMMSERSTIEEILLRPPFGDL